MGTTMRVSGGTVWPPSVVAVWLTRGIISTAVNKAVAVSPVIPMVFHRDADCRQAEAKHAAHDPQADALDEQLADDPPAARAESDPDGDLARSVHRA